MNRRLFLSAASGAVLSGSPAGNSGIPIIDTHIHLFDTTRPQGVPWPEKTNAALYKPSLPPRYRSMVTPLGVVGAIKVEASPWLEDNQWALDVAEKDPIIVGMVGNLDLLKPEFPKQFERFSKNPLFRGLRYGNIWDRNLFTAVDKPQFVSGLRILSQAGMSLDTANPNPELIAAVIKVSDKVPDLRVVLDHLPQMEVPKETSAERSYRNHLAELGKRPQVYVKLSSVYRRINGTVPRDLSVYKANLDYIVSVFGEDRILYGSDFPNSDNWRPYGDVLAIVQEYFSTKPKAVAEKYFWRNSLKAYRWKKRAPNQPSA